METSKHIIYWIKRKFILVIAAVMLGMSNAMYHEDHTISGNQIHTEQEDKKE
ncbi:hypothetical protein [Formosa sp. PL04]|uniref:hypothetical protein n=1 Tax=Formosa sp. PL04 TaxID=3081755 RepID=UPI002982995E|nr:hypothetical protein [Formosa sp. PL04]MDW5290904.1 hypothetical protein [Formosa sp. PL04]